MYHIFIPVCPNMISTTVTVTAEMFYVRLGELICSLRDYEIL